MTNDNATDRRKAHRLDTTEDHGIRAVRIRPGHQASVVNASAAGALLETNHRLLPGTRVDLHVVHGETTASPVHVRGRVIRCAVVQVRAATVFYRGAVAFDRHLPWFVVEGGEASAGHDGGNALPGVDQRAGRAQRADATRPVV